MIVVSRVGLVRHHPNHEYRIEWLGSVTRFLAVTEAERCSALPCLALPCLAWPSFSLTCNTYFLFSLLAYGSQASPLSGVSEPSRSFSVQIRTGSHLLLYARTASEKQKKSPVDEDRLKPSMAKSDTIHNTVYSHKLRGRKHQKARSKSVLRAS